MDSINDNVNEDFNFDLDDGDDGELLDVAEAEAEAEAEGCSPSTTGGTHLGAERQSGEESNKSFSAKKG